jgi:L-lactate dehydrogenase complex protein LldG
MTADSNRTLGIPKAEFLRSVRETLGRSNVPPETRYHHLLETEADLEQRAAEVRHRLERDRPALLDRLAEMAAKGGWNVHRAPGIEEALGHIEALAQRLGVTRVVRSGQEVFDQLPVDAALANHGMSITPVVRDETNSREDLREEIRQADLGLTGTDYALAETGSLVILPRRGLSRLVSLYPPVHVAVVRPQEVVETLDDLFLLRRLEYYQRSREMGSYLNFITGPSRTADIEMTIVEGVHGPKQVHLVLLG